ncbi:hypothetical protein MJ584_20080 [Klebsiella pneumoniae]|nr:hypothetical protein MJ584_20080 [Klebsiella pneumoniae]
MFIPKGSSIEFGTPSTVRFCTSPGRQTGNRYERFHYRSVAQSESYAQRRQ